MSKLRVALCALMLTCVTLETHAQESKNSAPDQPFRDVLEQAEKFLKGSKYAEAAP